MNTQMTFILNRINYLVLKSLVGASPSLQCISFPVSDVPLFAVSGQVGLTWPLQVLLLFQGLRCQVCISCTYMAF